MTVNNKLCKIVIGNVACGYKKSWAWVETLARF
jgi:hypothetical protein